MYIKYHCIMLIINGHNIHQIKCFFLWKQPFHDIYKKNVWKQGMKKIQYPLIILKQNQPPLFDNPPPPIFPDPLHASIKWLLP